MSMIDDDTVVTGSRDESIYVWKIVSGSNELATIKKIYTHKGYVNSLAYSPGTEGNYPKGCYEYKLHL